MSTTSLWNNIYQVLNAKRLESRIIKVFGSKKIKGKNKFAKNRYMSQMLEEQSANCNSYPIPVSAKL